MKRHVSFEIGDISGVTAKQIPLQDNFCDCGLFLLGYMEKFLKSPRALVTQLLQRDLDPDRDWPDVNPGKMRKMLKETLEGLWQAQKRRRTNDTNDAAALKALQKRGSQQVMKDTTLALAPARSDLMEGRSPTDDIQPDDQGRENTARAERIEVDLPSTKLMKALYDAAGAADDDHSNSLLITGSAPVEKEDQTRLKGEGSKGEGPMGEMGEGEALSKVSKERRATTEETCVTPSSSALHSSPRSQRGRPQRHTRDARANG